MNFTFTWILDKFGFVPKTAIEFPIDKPVTIKPVARKSTTKKVAKKMVKKKA